MAALRLPDDANATTYRIHPLQTRLHEQFAIEVPVYHWPAPPRRMLRISAQAYNSPAQYKQLADALKRVLDVA